MIDYQTFCRLRELYDEKGLKLSQIATELQLDPKTVAKWIEQPTYVGCAKLYRTRNQDSNMLDLSYNQNYSAESKLYFAGENYSVEGGWTEPALRSGLDCVMQYLHHNKAIFKTKDFNFGLDYPKWPPKI